MRLEDDLAVGAQQGAGEVEHRALEVGEREALVHREALHLLEHRAVGRVDVVAAIDESRGDQVDRRRLALHRPHLHRGRLAAQQPVRMALDVEVVARGARGVPLRRVEGGEVVPLGLDLGPVRDAVAQGQEDVLHLLADLPDRVERPQRVRVAGQRDVGPVALERGAQLLGLELLAARGQRRLDGVPHRVGGLPHRSPALGRQGSDARQDRGQPAAAPGVGHPRVLQLREARGGPHLGERLGLDLRQIPLAHRDRRVADTSPAPAAR